MRAHHNNHKHRMLILGLFGLLALNSWIAKQDDRGTTNMSSGLLQPGSSPTNGVLGNDAIANALGNCTASGQCSVTVTQKSGSTQASMTYRVALGKAEVAGGEDFMGNKIEAGTGGKVSIDLMGCASCGETRVFKTRNVAELLREAAKAIEADSKERVRLAEQERLNKIARDKLDKAIASCEKGDSGEVDTKGLPIGKALTRTERLDCMKDHMSGLDDKEQQAYFETTLLPLLNSMIDPSSTAADRAAVRAFAKGFDVGNRGIMDSVRVMGRASQYQDAALQIVRDLRANPRNSDALAALTRMQGQISQDMLLQTGSVTGQATYIGRGLGSQWANRIQAELNSATDGVRMSQMQQARLMQANAPYDPRYPQQRYLNNGRGRPGPVPRPGYSMNGQPLASADRAVWEDPCYNGRSSGGESCRYTPTGTTATVDPVIID